MSSLVTGATTSHLSERKSRPSTHTGRTRRASSSAIALPNRQVSAKYCSMTPDVLPPSITIAICTHNRASYLGSFCLESLCHQSTGMDGIEILVIDNVSADNTKKVVEEYQIRLPVLRYCYESVPGLSWARNRAVSEAHSDWIAYIDDDAIADRNWLSELKAFILRYPGTRIFGGASTAIHEIAPPTWLPESYGTVDLGDSVRAIDMKYEGIIGCNFAVRRDVFDIIGSFNTALGMSGKRPAWGEETEFLCRAISRGIAIYYAPALSVEHLVQPGKYDLRWQMRAAFTQGRINRLTHPGINDGRRPIGRGTLGWTLILPALAKVLLLALIGRLNSGHKRTLYQRSVEYLYHLGRCFGYNTLAPDHPCKQAAMETK